MIWKNLMHWWPVNNYNNNISRKLPVKATSGVHFIYPKVRVWVAVKEYENMVSSKNIYINPNPDKAFSNV